MQKYQVLLNVYYMLAVENKRHAIKNFKKCVTYQHLTSISNIIAHESKGSYFVSLGSNLFFGNFSKTEPTKLLVVIAMAEAALDSLEHILPSQICLEYFEESEVKVPRLLPCTMYIMPQVCWAIDSR